MLNLREYRLHLALEVEAALFHGADVGEDLFDLLHFQILQYFVFVVEVGEGCAAGEIIQLCFLRCLLLCVFLVLWREFVILMECVGSNLVLVVGVVIKHPIISHMLLLWLLIVIVFF